MKPTKIEQLSEMRPTKIEQLSEGMQVVMKKMFDIVDAPYSLELTEDWYTKYEWSEAQEKEFKEFFLDFAKNHPKRKDVISSLCRNKKDREQTFAWFNLIYGWKNQTTCRHL